MQKAVGRRIIVQAGQGKKTEDPIQNITKAKKGGRGTWGAWLKW
jgi:hypothetical protein